MHDNAHRVDQLMFKLLRLSLNEQNKSDHPTATTNKEIHCLKQGVRRGYKTNGDII